MCILGFTWLKIMRRFINASALSFVVLLLIVSGCNKSEQKVIADNNSEISNVSQDNSFTVFGVSETSYKKEIELRLEAEKQREKAKEQVEQIIRDGNLDVTEERLLEEIKQAQKKENNELSMGVIKSDGIRRSQSESSANNCSNHH